jgi:hypothetical protein
MERTDQRLVKNLGVSLRRPCRGQSCAGMLRAMARIALARHASDSFSRIGRLFIGFSNRRATINER